MREFQARIKILLFLFVGILITENTYSQFSEDFNDGNFTKNPPWDGDSIHFEVDSNLFLHLSAPPISSSSFLTTPSQSINNARWEFLLRMDFNPSSSNYTKVYIVSDQPDLNIPLHGYFVKIGGSADDISLYRQDGLKETKVIDGKDGALSSASVRVRVRVERDSLGNWSLYRDTTGGNKFVMEGVEFDSSYKFTRYFGVKCKYTVTRSDKFYFDDFIVTGDPYIDTISPYVERVRVHNNYRLSIHFNEPLEINTGQDQTNYLISNNIGMPFAAIIDSLNPAIVYLDLADPLVDGGVFQLKIVNIEDLLGNVINNSSFTFYYHKTTFNDIIISELLADPEPVVGLPSHEFIEIYNRTSYNIDLLDWSFGDKSKVCVFNDVQISSGEYLIICDHDDALSFAQFGSVMGVNGFPSLNNDGDELTIKDQHGILVFNIGYDKDWILESVRKEGGRSLEIIDTD
ncbi:MAG: lamin tail domain-containing protein, partial [Bacteroidetes bacterium]|nr:lamin tail domain-containing protein [Bacteroidota bacterium]